jgi:uncharacterized membrane protein
MVWILIIFSTIIYSILCAFSIKTGVLYIIGRRELTNEELSDSTIKKIKDKKKYAKKIGIATFIEGIFQGIAAIFILLAIINSKLIVLYDIAMIFNVFSFISIFIKLWNMSSKSAWIKIVCYSIILCGWVLSFAK